MQVLFLFNTSLSLAWDGLGDLPSASPNLASGVDVNILPANKVLMGVTEAVPLAVKEDDAATGWDGPGWDSFKVDENDVALELVDFGGLTPKGT